MANITNYLNKIKTAVYGKDVRGAIHDAIKQVYDDASVNHDNANMEVKMARGTHNTLNDRLDKSEQKLDETNAQLSDVFLQLENTAKSVVKVKTNADSANQLKGCVTFIDDDGVIEVKTLLKPLFDKYNKKFSIAIPTSQIGTSGRLTWDDVRMLRDNGIDILSHGHSHNVFGDMSREQQVYDIEQSKIIGMNNGIIFNDIVYPGNRPGNVKDIVLKYFRSGIGLNGATYNNTPVITREMQRVELGSWQNKTTEEIKRLIDTVKENGKWLILMTHCSVTGANAHPDGNMNTIETVLKYCCDNNLDVLTYDDAYRKHCNVLEVGDWGNTNQNYVVMGSDYIVRSYNKDFLNSINRIKYKDLPISTLPNAISIDENIVYTKVTSSAASSEGVPLNLPGLLKTEKFGTGSYVGYTKQTYSIHDSFRRFYRYCNDNGAWSQWFEDTPFDWKCQSIDYDSTCDVKCTSTIDASGRSLLFITSPPDAGANIIKWITPSKPAQIIVLINKLDADVTLKQGISGANLHFKTDGDYVLKKYRSISFINVSGELVEI